MKYGLGNLGAGLVRDWVFWGEGQLGVEFREGSVRDWVRVMLGW